MNRLEVKVLEYNVDNHLPNHMNWFTIDVKNIPRSLQQQISRHTSIRQSTKSTRYTLKEIKGLARRLDNPATLDSELYSKFLYLTGNINIDHVAHKNLAKTAALLELGYSNDEVKTTLPDGFLCDTVLTMTIEAWNWLYKLRSGKEVYKPFRELVEAIKAKLENVTPHNYEIQNTEILTASIACRTCWNSHKHSDDGGEKDRALVKRVGVKFKHRSVLSHLMFRVNPHTSLLFEIVNHRHYRKFVDSHNDLLLINMRTVVEIFEDKDFVHEKELLNVLPAEYKYLVEDLIE